MPQAFLTFVGLVTGYLHGAGLGALLLSYYPSASVRPDFELVLIAVLILGPAGALAGAVAARAGNFVFSLDGVFEKSANRDGEPSRTSPSSSC